MKTLYFDCFAGASGNMILGALVALGIDKNELIEKINLLNVSRFEIVFREVDRSGIKAFHVEVKVADENTHRHLHTIEKIINNSRLSDLVKKRAVAIFTKLAEAEAKVHGIETEKVHFHEVGAMDAIVDVVGACIGFEMLGIEKFACSKIHVGSGFVNMAHGKFPVPPPAVSELLQNVPIYSTEIEGELITPTGAAIISTVCESFGIISNFKIEKTAYGAGTREYESFPNVLRLFLGETENASDKKSKSLDEVVAKENKTSNKYEYETGNLILLETNLDDNSPQTLGFVMERAFESGALDCWFTSIQMKKNRPATLVSILCEREKREVLSELLFTETTTLGIRVLEIERNSLPREIVKVQTEFGEVDVKIARFGGKFVNAKPEYEQIRKIALKSNKTIKEIETEILEKFNEQKEK
ncbi:MAG: nickel pincer cofactor biosynthesis protein LarC [Acidobacteria bacterium]|nr:nickel pincer cofactor biosynthesis protein LarC [Acidobacteriota bacterium]MCA1640037.1 nickel pincer cofactor biosynthesis protein LarC [Acidobacteriota bacterium]